MDRATAVDDPAYDFLAGKLAPEEMHDQAVKLMVLADEYNRQQFWIKEIRKLVMSKNSYSNQVVYIQALADLRRLLKHLPEQRR